MQFHQQQSAPPATRRRTAWVGYAVFLAVLVATPTFVFRYLSADQSSPSQYVGVYCAEVGPVAGVVTEVNMTGYAGKPATVTVRGTSTGHTVTADKPDAYGWYSTDPLPPGDTAAVVTITVEDHVQTVVTKTLPPGCTKPKH
jgi:hypothetical protein